MSVSPVTPARAPAPDRTRPIRTGRAIAISVAAGLAMAVLWSYEFVDSVIGDNLANSLLGHDAKTEAIAGTTAGLLFAFVSGLAGTFTACNIAVASSVGPMAQVGGPAPSPVRALARPVGLLAAGMCAVSAVYGFVGVLLGDRLPQLSTAMVGDMPVRLIQSSVVFGAVGLALTYLGLAALGVLPDPFARRLQWRVVALGALVGGFLIGRPYPLFNKLFHWAADTGNPLVGSAAFVLQSLGNILLVTLLFAALVAVTRGAFLRMLAADPRRSALMAGTLLLALGVFTVVYWDVRVPAMFGFGWFPTMFYNH